MRIFERSRIRIRGGEGRPMKPPVFEYERPDSLRAALDLLARHGGKAKLLAGGYSLVPMLNLRAIKPSRLIDVSRLAELQYIIEEFSQLRIGALTTHNTILRSSMIAASCPIVAEAYRHVANHSIRNRGTLGGNLCHNDPTFEMPLVINLLGGTMVARSARGSRTITAQKFFKAPFATDLAADEMLIEVRVPRMPSGHGYCFLEVSQRLGDRALVAAGSLLTNRYGACRDVRIGFRSAGDNIYRVAAAEAAIEGKPASAALIEAAAEAAAAAISPPSDLHADDAYRRDVAATLTRRMLRIACERAGHAVDG
jgi:aerobic carbon-monoxide dehydrogenase medium subunit